jgi:hypothetical protein
MKLRRVADAALDKFRVLVWVVLMLLAGSPASAGDAPMHYVYHPGESPLDRRYDYQWEILRTALERTVDKYGPFRMERAATRMTETRQAIEMRNPTGKLTVMYRSTTPEFERELIPVRIPVDKNLGGYCVLLIRKEDAPRFAAIRSEADLKALSFGLGLGWVDVEILKHNSLRVVTGSNYNGLFRMLLNKRFDGFLRATVEVIGEYEARKQQMPDLYIEPTLLIYYPLPMYFWFPKTPEGERLAARARDGMMSMIEDGTYDRIFFEYQREKIEQLNLKGRRVFRIKNPFLGPETPLDDKRLWFDPLAGN